MSTGTVNNKPFSISFGAKGKPPAAKANLKKRSYATLTEDDSEEEQGATNGKVQLVHSFDQAAGGAVGFSQKEEKGPIVIAAQKNLNWRDEAKRRRRGTNILPAEEQARRAGLTGASAGEQTQEEKPQYGLLVSEKREVVDDLEMQEAVPVQEEKPRTADEEAIEALLGEKKSSMVIEHAEQEDTRFANRPNDTRAFQADIAARPESASLADYEAVPIEEFGLALLRGQGYKPGDPIGRRKTVAPVIARVPQRRANLLGLGAKEVPEGLEEMGAWGKGAKKGSKLDKAYNPLVLKNKDTGEVLTEAELKARQELDSLVEDDMPIRGKEKSRRHRDYDEDRHESSRHSSSKRDRSRSVDRHDRSGRERDGERKKRYDDYDDRDYERRKDRKSHRDDNYERREKRDRSEDRSSRRRDDSRYESRKDDYEDRKYRDRRREDRR